MGLLVDGKWIDKWYDTKASGGKFIRQDAGFRNWITSDGSAGVSGKSGFKAESGRYHLYVSLACPWAHRTLIFRELKDLQDHISVDVVHPDMMNEGWTFEKRGAAKGDSLFQSNFAHEIYTRADPRANTRVTVPILWDKKTSTIVSNESSEIIRMFNSAFDHITGNNDDYWPSDKHTEIEKVNAKIYSEINNGVYKAGFASTQIAYDNSVNVLFDCLDWVENRLQDNQYLLGDTLTEADWRLFTTLVRFDSVYVTHFKCNRKRVIDYYNIWNYVRELYQFNGIKETTDFDHIVRHYHYSHETINPNRIIPTNPVIDWNEAYERNF